MKVWFFLLTAISCALFSFNKQQHHKNDIELQAEELLFKIDNCYKNEKTRELAHKSKVLDLAALALFNPSELVADLFPFLVDKFIELQDFAISFAEKHPEMVASGKLSIPKTPLTKERINNFLTVSLKALYSSEDDYVALREKVLEYQIKDDLLWDFEDDFEWDASEIVEEMLVYRRWEEIESIVKNAKDPLLSEFYYQELFPYLESCGNHWVEDNIFEYYGDYSIDKNLGLTEAPKNALEQKFKDVIEEVKVKVFSVSKERRKQINLLLQTLFQENSLRHR